MFFELTRSGSVVPCLLYRAYIKLRARKRMACLYIYC